MRPLLVLLLLLVLAGAGGGEGHPYYNPEAEKILALIEKKRHAWSCRAKGGTLLTIEHVAVVDGEMIPLWSIAIYGSGAWRRTTWTTEGPRVSGACLDSRARNFVWDQLYAMKWRGLPARCALAQPTQTIYRKRDKQRFVARACGPELDADTAERLVEIEAVLQASLRKLIERETIGRPKNSP